MRFCGRAEPEPEKYRFRVVGQQNSKMRADCVKTGKCRGNTMNMKRTRSRHHRPGSNNNGGSSGARLHNGQVPLNRNHVFDSNGPEVRIRGTAQQLFEKYLQLGRDATSGGDRVTAEAYFQHAEHYFRILNAMNQAAQQAQIERQERTTRSRPNYQQNESAGGAEENHSDQQGEAQPESEAVAS